MGRDYKEWRILASAGPCSLVQTRLRVGETCCNPTTGIKTLITRATGPPKRLQYFDQTARPHPRRQ